MGPFQLATEIGSPKTRFVRSRANLTRYIVDRYNTRWWFQTWEAIFVGGNETSCKNWVVVSNIFIFTPTWGRFPILTNIFQMGWFNHQLAIESYLCFLCFWYLESFSRQLFREAPDRLEPLQSRFSKGPCGLTR